MASKMIAVSNIGQCFCMDFRRSLCQSSDNREIIPMKTIFTRAVIILVLLAGFAFRLYQFPAFPEMHADETGFAYSTYSWFKTGVDEYGRRPGILLESLGDWKLALYAYLVFPLIALFGLQDWAVRLPSLLLGVLTVPVLYVLTKRLFGRKDLAVISALILWILPWHIIFSRTGNEVNLELILMLVGIYFFLRWIESRRWKNILLASLSFCLSVLSYYPAFVTIPLIALILPVVYLRTTWRDRLMSVVPFLSVCVVLGLFLLTQPKDRISQTSFVNSEGPQSVVFDRVTEAGLAQTPALMTRVLHNKVTVGFAEFLTRYLAHFDWRFLLIEGEPGDSRYDLPYQGPLYVWMGIVLIFGGAIALTRVVRQDGQPCAVVFLVLLTAMVPGAMTVESVNLQRAFLVIPDLVWLMAIGLVELWNIVSNVQAIYRRAILLGFAVLVSVNTVYFWQNYFVHHQYRRPWGRHGYVAELSVKLQQHAPQFERTFIADLPYLPMLYYLKIDPTVAQKMLHEESYKRDSATVVRKFGAYDEMRVRCPLAGKLQVLYVCKGDAVPEASRVIDVVRYRDGIPAYTLIELLPRTDQRIMEAKPDRVVVKKETIGQDSITDEPGVFFK